MARVREKNIDKALIKFVLLPVAIIALIYGVFSGITYLNDIRIKKEAVSLFKKVELPKQCGVTEKNEYYASKVFTNSYNIDISLNCNNLTAKEAGNAIKANMKKIGQTNEMHSELGAGHFASANNQSLAVRYELLHKEGGRISHMDSNPEEQLVDKIEINISR